MVLYLLVIEPVETETLRCKNVLVIENREVLGRFSSLTMTGEITRKPVSFYGQTREVDTSGYKLITYNVRYLGQTLKNCCLGILSDCRDANAAANYLLTLAPERKVIVWREY